MYVIDKEERKKKKAMEEYKARQEAAERARSRCGRDNILQSIYTIKKGTDIVKIGCISSYCMRLERYECL